jgi:ABC-type polysaccharide/polyol phosphate export systems, permease component
VTDVLPDAPPPELRYRRGLKLGPSLRSLWSSRHLIVNLGKRELRVKYSQAVLGLAWAILTPLVLMLVFSIVIPKVGKVATHGIAYPVYLYTGLLAWTFFSSAVSSASLILVGNPLLNKVYAPREVFALATIGTSGVDALAASLILGILFVVYGDYPQITSYWVPVYVLVLVAFTVGIGLIVSSVTVFLRDLRHALPLMLQVGLFVSSVIVGIDRIPAKYRTLYVTLNPVAMVIDGLRRTVLYGHQPNFQYLGLGSATSIITLIVGYAIFKQLETGFADVS